MMGGHLASGVVVRFDNGTSIYVKCDRCGKTLYHSGRIPVRISEDVIKSRTTIRMSGAE